MVQGHGGHVLVQYTLQYMLISARALCSFGILQSRTPTIHLGMGLLYHDMIGSSQLASGQVKREWIVTMNLLKSLEKVLPVGPLAMPLGFFTLVHY